MILVAERRGNPTARRRHDREARLDHRPRRGRVPRVRQDKRGAGHVEAAKRLALLLERIRRGDRAFRRLAVHARPLVDIKPPENPPVTLAGEAERRFVATAEWLDQRVH